jgi:hypothetical protein
LITTEGLVTVIAEPLEGDAAGFPGLRDELIRVLNNNLI